jgi:hypothetical protein
MKDRGEKKFVAINFTKLNYFSFEILRKKNWANFQRIIELFTQKIVTKLSKIWVWDPRSGIRDKPILDPGSRGQKGTGSRIRIRNTDFYVCSPPFCSHKFRKIDNYFIFEQVQRKLSHWKRIIVGISYPKNCR